ncbi:hypothetical protein HY440_00305 [Candidatus Microgenomates bacterium]|nr:hypothetical protein [Candidatus Microgenomates bacterium]
MEENLRLTLFEFEQKAQPVAFVSKVDVAPGVSCDTYAFVGDQTKDLGIIKIEPGYKTPLQKVLKGERTVEGYVSGKGVLRITKPDSEQKIYRVDENKADKPLVVTVEIGELMQWEADKDSKLIAYEVCFPPYQDGRYENID